MFKNGCLRFECWRDVPKKNSDPRPGVSRYKNERVLDVRWVKREGALQLLMNRSG